MRITGYIALCLLTVLLSLPEVASAQLWGLGLSGNSEFTRQLNAVNWDLLNAYSYDQQDFDLHLTNHFERRFYFLNGSAQNIQNENRGYLSFTKWQANNWGYGLTARSFSFTNTHVRQNVMMAGPVFRWAQNWRLAPEAGFMIDQRNKHTDDGLALGLRAYNPNLQVGDLTFQPNLFMEYANIRPRQYHTYRVQTAAHYRKDDIQLRAHVNLGESKQESYQPSNYLNRNVNNVLESVVSDSSLITMDLNFPIYQKLKGDVNLSTQTNVRRFINNPIGNQTSNDLFDSRFIHRELDLNFTSRYQAGFNNLTGGFDYQLINAGARLINTGSSTDLSTYAAQLKSRQEQILNASNFDQSEFALFTQNKINISAVNTIHFGGRISILRYNTPETTDDDHDILAYLINISDEHRFTDYLTARINLSGQAFHNVYIYASRSIENNWRRSIRLVPEMTWRPTSWLSINQQFLIRANYTVYDYKLQGQPLNDQASREWGARTEANIQAAPDWSFSLSASRNELRIGQLYWKSFKEVPLDTLVTWTGEATITHQEGRLTITAGMRMLMKYDYLPSTELQATVTENGTPQSVSWLASGRQKTVQWGPIVTISLPFEDGNALYLDGWIQRQAINKKQYTRYPQDQVAAFTHAARSWSHRLFPNLTLNARFRL